VRRQLDLFSRADAAPGFDAGFASLRRIELGDGAWVDLAPRWVDHHDALFEELERDLPWRHESMWIYERKVEVPRMLAPVPGDHRLLGAMRDALSARYRERFVRITAALYRDGRDSVAFHGDTVARDLPEALVATISLGATRGFLLRPTEGGASRRFELGGGDLCVMGGTCQRTWRHGIPKVAKAGPRIAVMFRPAWAEAYEG
jgi:alkylated DNA repair dioxygenase AlkB